MRARVSTCVFVCVCVYVRACVCMMCVRVCCVSSLSLCACVCTYVRMYVCMYVCVVTMCVHCDCTNVAVEEYEPGRD